MVLWEVLWGWSVHSTDDDMVSFVWFKRDSLDWSEFLFLKLLDFGSVDDLWGLGGVDARSLDGNDEMASVLHEVGGVETEDSSLIWLGDISEDNVNHWHEHSVFLWMSSVLNNWNDIGSLLGHVDQVSAGSLGELNSVHATGWSNQISNVGNSGSGSSSNIEDLAAWLHVDVSDTSNDGSSDLGSEWVPDSVLCLNTFFLFLYLNYG